MRDIAMVFLGTAFVGLMLMFAAERYLSFPVVYVSHSTGECVRVEPEEVPCDDLPERYMRVWVE